MKKSIKKLAVGTMAGALSLMAVGTSVDAATIIAMIETSSFTEGDSFELDVTRSGNGTQSGKSSVVYFSDGVADNGISNYYKFDLSTLAWKKMQIIGEQEWSFMFTNKEYEGNGIESITLMDDQDNVIDQIYGGVLDPFPGAQFSRQLTTELQMYDLDYDGCVDLDDAQLALQIAQGIKEPSELQVILGDADYSDEIDNMDAEVILRVALGIV